MLLTLVLLLFAKDLIAQQEGSQLMNAIRYGNVERVQSLLQQGANINETYRGTPAFVYAAEYGDKKGIIVQKLLQSGADVNEKSYNWKTALYWAARKGDEQIVQILLQSGADVNLGKYSKTPSNTVNCIFEIQCCLK